MKSTDRNIHKIAAVYNIIPSLVWTAAFLVPVAVFCYRFLDLKNLYILLGISLLPMLFPNAFFDRIQLSGNSRFYKRMGVEYINAFAQGGQLINTLIKKKHPDFKVVSLNSLSIRKQYHQTYMFEKFHLAVFIFVAILTIKAAMMGAVYWVLVLIICNLFYNVYPNLLQQYLRVKLKPGLKRGSR